MKYRKTTHLPDEHPPRDPHDVRPEYVRRREAARFLGLAVGTLANWASAGKGPAFHRLGGGNVIVYDVAELTRFAQAGRIETSAA